ncbi:hypothetical protein [Acidiferrobacter sp.]|uniref:hypothetical protein n=1 Tax=Acidiferrobacter sp. TaxID=1872107 RepID=UPI00260AF8CA|nr:hypothetical protein [Acidiferrobacter sp.]
MANAYSMDDLLEFLDHAGDRGLMPAATAQALVVATRNILGILTEDEKTDLSQLDLNAAIQRFANKRAKDFNPASIKEYGRRVRRAVELFLSWREDPANFTIKTRTTSAPRRKDREVEYSVPATREAPGEQIPGETAGTYRSAFPVRPGLVVTLVNVPNDLSSTEAERLANFIKMLAVK